MKRRVKADATGATGCPGCDEYGYMVHRDQKAPVPDQDMKQRVKAAYLSGEVRLALEKRFSGDLADAILDTLRRGLA